MLNVCLGTEMAKIQKGSASITTFLSEQTEKEAKKTHRTFWHFLGAV
jgi:hypothetical protein